MNKADAEKLLKRVRLELARDHDFPNGSSEHGYDFIAPIDDNGHIAADAWKLLRDRCRVKRFWEGEPDEVGHIVRKPGGSWAFHYDIHGDAEHDESGYRFDAHVFQPGQYVSLKEQDGQLKTFIVKSVRDEF
ncbi:MAG: hypothetical protein RLZ98_2043 [Pseudomonadota bacterium]|jgi:hypothetical protein